MKKKIKIIMNICFAIGMIVLYGVMIINTIIFQENRFSFLGIFVSIITSILVVNANVTKNIVNKK